MMECTGDFPPYKVLLSRAKFVAQYSFVMPRDQYSINMVLAPTKLMWTKAL